MPAKTATPPDLSPIEVAKMSVRSVVKPRMSILREKYSPIEWWKTRRSDVFIVWFPKTGGTWVRLMLNTALQKHTGVVPPEPLFFEEFSRSDPSIPRIRWLHDDEPHWKRPRDLTPTKERYRGKKVILLVRDPRDAAVSLYFQMTRRWKVTRRPLRDFLWQERGSVRTMVRYYNIWARNRDVPADLALVRYEDVHGAPDATLRRLLDFAGIPQVSDAAVRDAVAESSFDALRKREASGTYSSSRLRPGAHGDPESFKARRGKIGGFAEYLEEGDIVELTRLVREELDPWYGYRDDVGPPAGPPRDPV